MAFFLKGAAKIRGGAPETLKKSVSGRVVFQIPRADGGHIEPILMLRLIRKQAFSLLTCVGELSRTHGSLNVFESVGRDLGHGVSRWVSK